MFGMSLGEIFVIAIIAILFVGPDKLPDALVKIAKFFRSFKSTINDAKESFDREIQIKELKEEALNYKKQLTKQIDETKEVAGLDKLDDIYKDFNSLNSPIDTDDFDEVVEIEKKEKPKKKKTKKAKKVEQKEDEDV